MEEKLEKVRVFAEKAHEGQVRKYSPEPYIVHPVRVMKICAEYVNNIEVLSAALLHDVLEDTSVTRDSLNRFLSEVLDLPVAQKTTALVVELTDVYTTEDFPQWNRRKRKLREADRIEKTSGESQTIKYADIIDNCSEIAEKDPDFAFRFLKECRGLLKRMKKGNKELYERSMVSVDETLKKLC